MKKLAAQDRLRAVIDALATRPVEPAANVRPEPARKKEKRTA